MSDNKIDVSIAANTGDLNSGLDQAERAINDTVDKIETAARAIKLKIDLDDLRAQMTQVEQIIKRGIADATDAIKLQIDSTALAGDLGRAKSDVQSAFSAVDAIKLEVDMPYLRSQISAAKTQAESLLSSVEIRIGIDRSAISGGLSTLNSTLATTFAALGQIKLEIDLPYLRAQINLADVALRGLTTNFATGHIIDITVNRTRLRAQLAAAESMVRAAVARISALASSITISVNIDSVVTDLITALNELKAEVIRLRLQLASGGAGGSGGNGGSGFAGSFMGNLASELAMSALYGAVQLTGALLQTSDSTALLNARFTDLLGTAEEVKTIKGELYDAAQRLQVGYAEMSNAAARMLPSLQEMGKGTADAVKLSEILMTTAKLSGASTQEATSAAQQFSQALGSGVLNGDELKSILENNQSLARSLAAALKLPNSDIKVTIGMLRDLGSEGKITSEILANALLNSYDTIMAKTDQLPVTFQGAWQRIKNAAFMAIDQMTERQIFAGAIDQIGEFSKAIDALAKDGSLVEWAESIMGVLSTLGGIFRELLGIVFDVLGEIASLWGGLAQTTEQSTGAQIGAMQLLTNMLKVVQVAFIALRTGINVVMIAIKAVVTDVVAAMIAIWVTFRTSINITILTVSGYVEGLILLLQTLARVAGRALMLDFSGAIAAWDAGTDKIAEVVRSKADQIKDETQRMKNDLGAAAATSASLGGNLDQDIARAVGDGAARMNQAVIGGSGSAPTPTSTAAAIGAIERVELGAGKAKAGKKPPKEPSKTRELEAELDRKKLAFERENEADGTLKEFPIERVAEYWREVSKRQDLSAQERLDVEKRLATALRTMRERDVKNELDDQRTQLQEFSANHTQRLAIATQIAERTKFLYGEQSDEYRRAMLEQLKIAEDVQRHEYDMARRDADANEKASLDLVDIASDAAQQQYDLGLISQRQMLAAEQAFEDQRYQIKKAAAARRLALFDAENIRTGGKMNPTDRLDLVDQGDAVEDENATNKRGLGNQQQMLDTQWMAELSQQASSLWDRGLQSMMDGTLTWKGAMQAIWSDMSMFFLKKLVTDPLRDWALMQGRKLMMHLFYKKAEVATEAAGEAAKTGAVAAGETARTGFTLMGVMARIGMAIMEAIKTIGIYAWTAMAGAYAAISAIPIVGPVLAPIAAAATFAGVIGLVGKVKSASGGYDIPAGVNPMTQLHAEEMVLPAKYANVIRGMAGGESAGGGASPVVNVNIHALDAKSVKRVLVDNRGGLATAIQAGIRDFKGGKK